MSEPTAISFRIFAGPHMGAELVLSPGTTLLGSDDACDIILQDDSVAPRHARITIQVAEGKPSVHIAPLDQAILVQGESIPAEGYAWPPAEPCFLGLTCLAWSLPEEALGAWSRVLSTLQREAPLSGEKAAAKTLSDEVPGGASDAEQSPPDESIDNNVLDLEPTWCVESNDIPTHGVEKTLWSSPKKLLLLGLGLLCLCGLIFSYAGLPASAEKRTQQVQELLTQKGFPQLRAMPMGQGVSVLGIVRNDGERNTLLKLAQTLHYPVHLEILVQGDRVEAVRSAFNSRGFFPEVREEDNTLKVSGYAKDGLAEEWAFTSVRSDIPELRDEAVWNGLERTIRYAKDVEPVLRRELQAKELHFVGVRYLSGQVELAGSFDSEQHQRLSQVLEAVRLELGVPVLFTVVPSFARSDNRRNVGEGARPASAFGERESRFGGASAAGAESDEAGNAVLSGVQVSGVTLSPMRFIALANGQRIFEGGLLPGGFTLEKIDVNALTLRKDGQTVLYRLQGAQHE